MVGGLVEEEQLRVRGQCLGQEHAALQAAGEGREVRFRREVETRERLGDPALRVPVALRIEGLLQAGHLVEGGAGGGGLLARAMEGRELLAHRPHGPGHHVEDAALRAGRNLLREARDPQAATAFHRACIRLDLAGEKPQQGGLAGAVAAHHAHALVLPHLELHVLEQGVRATYGECHVLHADQGHRSRSRARSPSRGPGAGGEKSARG